MRLYKAKIAEPLREHQTSHHKLAIDVLHTELVHFAVIRGTVMARPEKEGHETQRNAPRLNRATHLN